MDAIDTQEAIRVMQAYVEGETIQASEKYSNSWCVLKSPNWNWEVCTYRVKPKPKYYITFTTTGGALILKMLFQEECLQQ